MSTLFVTQKLPAGDQGLFLMKNVTACQLSAQETWVMVGGADVLQIEIICWDAKETKERCL